MILSIKGLSFAYPKKPLFKNFSLQLEKGESLALLGKSGAGKTTLFRLITGLLKPQAGTIKLDGTLSYLMQDDLLLPWRSALDNVHLFAELRKTPNLEKAKKMLSEVGLEAVFDLMPHELSGGMRKRVALARTLLFPPGLILLDEAFAGIDFSMKKKLYALINRLKKRYQLTLLLITHEPEEAALLTDRQQYV